VVAPILVRVEMFRAGRTCELLITKHWLGPAEVGKRPTLESSLLFRGVQGYLEIDPGKKDQGINSSRLPVFYSRGGESREIPEPFRAAVEAVTRGTVCIGCTHGHYLAAPKSAGLGAQSSESGTPHEQSLAHSGQSHQP
jgi:hypothetical protein